MHIVDPHSEEPFPSDLEPDEAGLVALGGRLSVRTILSAYTRGIFPWTGADPIVPWFSPDPRLVLFPDRIHVAHSLRQVLRRGGFSVGSDGRFEEVVHLCATVPRADQDGTWITPDVVRVWHELHNLGYAHSVEVFQEGELVGGLYGMALGKAFFGESMCSLVPNASKVALVDLCKRLAALDFYFIDCQQVTDHMLRMGGTPLDRKDYLRRLHLALSDPDAWR